MHCSQGTQSELLTPVNSAPRCWFKSSLQGRSRSCVWTLAWHWQLNEKA